ncbi:MAG: hypothetical protein RIR66_55 [Actinomycetota bacterium]|jgi:hypothetical protein
MTTCGAVVGGRSIENVDISKQAVIQGVVQKSGAPVSVGYVRLLDRNDEFVAEVPVSQKGEFRFFAAAGSWNIVTLVPGGSARQPVTANLGQITDVDVLVG